MDDSPPRPTSIRLAATQVLAELALLANCQPVACTDFASERVIDARTEAFEQAARRRAGARRSVEVSAAVRG